MEISTNKLNYKINSTNFRKDFTISLTDKKKKKFKVAIDKTASSPLYYVIGKKKICLSDNIDKFPKTSLNIKAINKYLNYGLIPAFDTIYKNIYKLESGSYSFDFNCKTFIKNKKKKLNKISLKKSLDKIPSNIKNYLNGKNLAVLITGGLDSSFLAALTKEMKPVLFFASIEDN
ncbi:MAG: hypothetical protein K9L76_03935 [Candidatus Omnitrophica bacterium]|nr:hypothetical protein [Candidatus Omnitrophota bacterium]